jgi:parallel beta-helix repeat protein
MAMKRLMQRRRSTVTVLLAAVIAACILALPTMAYAKTLYVSATGNDANSGLLGHPVKTVQKAIGLAISGDVVEVGAGTFSGDVTMTAGVSLYGAGTASTTLTGSGHAIVTANGIGTGTTISGFSITGNTFEDGIDCVNSSPRIMNCVVSKNHYIGIWCDDSSPSITNDTISDNIYVGIEYDGSAAPRIANDTITGNGSGVYSTSSTSPTITNDTITGNVWEGVECYDSSPIITNDTISGNNDNGIYCDDYSSPIITNDTISGNVAHGIYCDTNSSPSITNCIVWGDTGSELFDCSATYSDISTPAVGSNLDADPSFVSSATGDLHLKAGSPCIDKGTPVGAPSTDKDGVHRPQGTGFDMGAYEYHVTRGTKTKLVAPSSVKVKHSLRLSGTVSPSAASGTVTITMTRKVGKHWKSAGSKTVTLKKGKFSYSFKPKYKGVWSLTAAYSGYTGGKNWTVYTPSMSKTKAVKVK